MAVLLLLLSALPAALPRGVAMVAGGGKSPETKYVKESSDTWSLDWETLNWLSSTVVAAGVLGALVATTCCACACIHYRNRRREDAQGDTQ